MDKTCIAVPEIVLPAAGVDMTAWAVIACDQHTSDAAYWEELDRFVGGRPSALRLTLPEIYLSDSERRTAEIERTMREYRARGIFRKLPPGFVAVGRSAPGTPVRRGIVLAVDLEAYSYAPKSDAMIRATEATILSRIPPRLKIRENVSLEFPHIMLLYDDPSDTVGQCVRARLGETLYDFDLNMGGGHIRGRFVSDCAPVIAAFASLIKDGLLFMVGDGNHSLATAKAAWERLKPSLSAAERETHPARYALCEAVNLYDEGIRFEAIHRFVTGIDPDKFARSLSFAGEGAGELCIGGKSAPLRLPADVPQAVAAADEAIGAYIAENGGEVDYVHGDDAVRALTAKRKDSAAILLPKMDKAALFDAVKRGGSLPRKTFSMGESEEKRYYIEGKEIKK